MGRTACTEPQYLYKGDLYLFFSFHLKIVSIFHQAMVYAASIHHSFSSLSYDRSKASSKMSSPHSAIQSFFFQMRVSSPFLKVIQ